MEIIKEELRGWITPCYALTVDEAEARKELESIGVDTGGWNAERQEFERCVVSPQAFERLHPLWGRYIWGLE